MLVVYFFFRYRAVRSCFRTLLFAVYHTSRSYSSYFPISQSSRQHSLPSVVTYDCHPRSNAALARPIILAIGGYPPFDKFYTCSVSCICTMVRLFNDLLDLGVASFYYFPHLILHLLPTPCCTPLPHFSSITRLSFIISPHLPLPLT